MVLIVLSLANGVLAGETLALKAGQLYMVWDPRPALSCCGQSA